MASVESQVRLLTEDLAGARRELDRLSGGPDPLKRAILESGLAAAQSALDEAGNNLAVLQDGQDLLELALRGKGVQLAMEGLIEAKKDSRILESKMEQGPAALDLALLKAQVGLARSALDDAKEDLDGVIIQTPFAGSVSQINVDPDDDVNDESRIIESIDTSVFEILASVEGSEASQVREGAEARVTIDSMPGQEFIGEVTYVSPSPRTERGVITYPMVVRVQLAQGVEAPLRISSVTVNVVAGKAIQ